MSEIFGIAKKTFSINKSRFKKTKKAEILKMGKQILIISNKNLFHLLKFLGTCVLFVKFFQLNVYVENFV